MFKQLFFFALLVTITLASSSEPKFCHRLNCPTFTVVSTNGTYEIRNYENSWWASTNVSSFDFDEAGNIGFHRLFDYISGANQGNVNIPMTTPVLTEIYPGQGPFCASTFVVSFYVPYEYQAEGNAPAPTSSDVYLSQLPSRQVAVDSFSGYAHWNSVRTQAGDLAAYLQSQKILFNPLLSVAQYDSPFDVIDRHNEIWYEILD